MIDTIYHTGCLIVDRRKDPELDKRAAFLWAQYKAGKMTLYTRRVGDPVQGIREYHARPVKGAV